MEKIRKLEPEKNYIILHVGNNDEVLFRESENCRYFSGLIEKHIRPVADILYCDMWTSRLEIRVRMLTPDKIPEKYRERLHQPFSNLFNSYTKAFNKRYKRNGSLFRVRFKRIEV